MKIYIDESGDLGSNGSKFFLIALVITNDNLPLKRISKKIRNRKLNKKMKNTPEIKANKSTEEIKKFALSKLAELDIGIYCTVLDKKNMYINPTITKNQEYIDLIVRTLGRIPLNENNLEIILDKSLSKKERKNLNEKLEKEVKQYKSFANIDIFHIDSRTSGELQAIDFIPWAILRKYEQKETCYYNLIKSKIISEEII